MMRRLFLCVGLFCLLGSSYLFADEKHEVRLNNYGKSKETISILGAYDSEICRIEAELGEVDDNGFYTINLSIENEEEVFHLYVFGNQYDKKQLRSLSSPAIAYAKGFKEDFTLSSSLVAQNGRRFLHLNPGDKEYLSLMGKEGDPSFECTIPLYFAKVTGWLFKKHSLMDVRIESLTFTVDIKPAPEYTKLSESVDQMFASLAELKYTVCKHGSGKKHNPDLEDQQAATRHQLDSLSKVASSLMESRTPGSKRYEELKAFKTRLDTVDLNRIPVLDCKISDKLCSCPPNIADMTLRQISYRMEELYLRIHNGKSTKEQVIGEVRALKVHSGHIRKDPERLKSGIDRYYNRINSL